MWCYPKCWFMVSVQKKTTCNYNFQYIMQPGTHYTHVHILHFFLTEGSFHKSVKNATRDWQKVYGVLHSQHYLQSGVSMCLINALQELARLCLCQFNNNYPLGMGLVSPLSVLKTTSACLKYSPSTPTPTSCTS